MKKIHILLQNYNNWLQVKNGTQVPSGTSGHLRWAKMGEREVTLDVPQLKQKNLSLQSGH